MKTTELTLKRSKCRSLFVLLISFTAMLQTRSDGAENLLDRDAELEIWVVNSNKVVINRQFVDYKDSGDLARIFTSFYEPLQSVIATLTITCDPDPIVLDQVIDAFGLIGLSRDQDEPSSQQTYRIKERCTTPPDVVMRTGEFILHSDEINQDYSVSITLPENYSPNQSYPLIVFTDANTNSGSSSMTETITNALQGITSTLLAEGVMPEVVLVGIGYPKRNFRSRDLLPILETNQYSDQASGAREFASFIETGVKPFIYSKAAIDHKKEIYLGHSYGGLFGAYILFNKSELFDGYVLSAPSFWYSSIPDGTGISYMYEEEYNRNNKDMAKSVYIAVGTEDRGNMAWNAKAMYDILASRKYESLMLRWELLKGKNHDRVLKPAYFGGLSFMFEGM